MKSIATITAEGACYAIISGGGPFVELLISDRELTTRSITATSVMSLVAIATALKAFLSQSMQSQGPMEVTAPPGEPMEVEVTKTPTRKSKP